MMETERTLENLLGVKERIYRVTSAQIDQLAQILLEEASHGFKKGVSHIISRNQSITHGAFKGTFENGVSRRDYAQAALKQVSL